MFHIGKVIFNVVSDTERSNHNVGKMVPCRALPVLQKRAPQELGQGWRKATLLCSFY